ncbi:MAG: type secretion system effector, Hcp1 family [Pedosphaera sp.]|nr:type secretion system effector, Hcp1 family [Pedosphaera sp.]
MAFDAFLKIECDKYPINGESTDKGHPNWIQLSEYSFGVSQPHAGSRSDSGAATGGRADFEPFTCKKSVDKASNFLMLCCASGYHIGKITVELCRATGTKQIFVKLIYTDCIITKVTVNGSGGSEGEIPTEDLEFNFGSVDFAYTPTNHKTGEAEAAVSKKWDVIQNAAA